jgi:hypothetical protein
MLTWKINFASETRIEVECLCREKKEKRFEQINFYLVLTNTKSGSQVRTNFSLRSERSDLELPAQN